MNLQGRNLTQGLSGTDVAELQKELGQLGYTIPATEQTGSSFGAGTLAAVEQFQTALNLTANGTVDTASATALTTAIADNTYAISGTVTSPTNVGTGTLAVQIVDKNVGGDVTVAQGQTKNNGSYSIASFVISPLYLRQHNKTKPDLQAKVLTGTTVLATSVPSYNAPLTQTLDVALPGNASGLPSEYETLTGALAALYTGKLSALQETAQQQDITYLANKSGWDARTVALAALADQFGALTAPAPTPAATATTTATATAAAPPAVPATTAAPATATEPHAAITASPASATVAGAAVTTSPALAQASTTLPLATTTPTTTTPTTTTPATPPAPPATVSVAPALYYALFRAGLPADAGSLFRVPIGTVQAIWQQAIAQGVIPSALTASLPAAATAFQALTATTLLPLAPPGGLSTLQQMLAPTLTQAAQQQQFAQIYAQHAGDWTNFWPAVQQALGATLTTQLKFMGQLFYLTANNQPLITALDKAEAASPLTSTLDLATRGYYDPAKWTPLIGSSIPPNMPGATAAEQTSNYAALLAAQVRVSYPTAVLSDQVRRAIVPIPDTAAVAGQVADFLNTHQADFSIGAEAVEAYIARTNLSGVSTAVVNHVKRLQRVYQLTDDDASLVTLLNHNLDSAFAITRYDEAGFVRAFDAKLGGDGKAKAVHKRARQVFGAVTNVVTGYALTKTTPSFGDSSTFLSGFQLPWPWPLPPTPTSYPIIAYPTLEGLFGSLDYCDCEDCSSILSPAAYLVDLLNYLDIPSPSAGYQNPQTVLLGRRPDLQYLPLTCANTNTALPYIDVVNETLEYFVANGLSIANYQGHDTGDTVTSAELLASPQYVNNAAYSTLQQAFFPPPLPFNRPLEYLRLQLNSLGVALPDAMIALRASDKITDTLTSTSYGWSDILIEQLGISRDEMRLFTDASVQLGDLYGMSNTGTVGLLNKANLQDYSQRTGVSYDDLTTILQTQFINPNAVLIERLQQLNGPFSTLQTLEQNLGTAQSIATQFINQLPAGLDATQYGGSSPTDYQAVVNWVTNLTNPVTGGPGIYPRMMALVTISNPTGSQDDCSGEALQFRYANGNTLSGTDYLKLIRFIRLWQLLQPLLGDADNSITIAQTDAILAALYPADKIPTNPTDPSQDGANRTLLDEGFNTLLLRTGFVFQVLNRLSLTADAGLTQLLACWAPIGTVGADALYQQMFLTPTLLAQDPGAQTATVSNAVNAGDQLETAINNSVGANNVSLIPAYKVTAGETATAVASAIAASINATTGLDAATGIAINKRFYATSQNNVITIKAGFTLAAPPVAPAVTGGTATETLTVGTQTPLSASLQVGGSATTPGDTLTVTIDTIAVPYVVIAGDTATSIAAGIAAAVNNTTVPDPYCALPLNNFVYASSSGTTVTIQVAGAGAPFALSCALVSANSGTYTAGTQVPAAQTATVSTPSAVAAADTLVTTINGVNLPYSPGTAATGATAATLASGIAGTINNTTATDPQTQLPLTSLIEATSAGAVVSIVALDPAMPFTLACSVSSGSETYISAGPFPASQTATIGGTIPAGAILTTTINGLNLFYTAATGDTPSTIASKIAALIVATATPDLVTNLPLNSVVTASAAAGVITITAASTTASFTLQVLLSASAYTAGEQTPPFADDGYGDFLSDPTQTAQTTPTLFAHEPALCAACNLTGAEFTLIAGPQGLNFNASTPLTLANVSALFRYGWLAHALGLSVLEFLLLRQFSGLDPFGSGPTALDLGTAAPVEPPIIRFIRLYQAMTAAGLQSVQALYLMWNQDISGTSTPPLSSITGLALTLRQDFAAVAAQFVLQDDPDGTIAQGLMTLVYGSDASAFFFGLLNNTFSTSLPYAAGLTTLAAPLVTASNNLLSYDDLAKQLSYAGYLTTAIQAALVSAATVATTDKADNLAAGSNVFTPVAMTNIAAGSVLVIDTGAAQEIVTVTAATTTTFTATTINAHNGTATPFAIVNDPTLITAINALAAANQQTVNAFFAVYPELLPLYNAFVASTDPLQTRRTTLLSNFLPTLIAKRNQEEALAAITAAAGSDPSFANELLSDATIIHADADPGAPAINDLTAINNQGLTAQFFLGNNVNAAPDQTVEYTVLTDQNPALSYVQTVTAGGTITINNVLTITINGTAVPYTVTAADTSLPVLAANMANAVNAAASVNQIVSASSNGPVIAIGAASPSGANAQFTLACAVSSGATATLALGSQLPTGNGGGPIAAIWSGYINVPQDGFYDFAVVADAGAGITLQIDDDTVIYGPPVSGVWNNLNPVSLVAGALVPFILTATSIKTKLSLGWQSQGMGWQQIPGQYLYPLNLMNSLGDTYIRFLKSTSLATALLLVADEISYLGTTTSYAVNTGCSQTINAGNAVFTPLSMANIATGSVLVIDTGTAQETVAVTAITSTTFSAVTTKSHTGSTAAPFSIVDQAQPAIGQGWLNFLTGMANPTTAVAAKLGDVLTALLDFARIKQALSPSDERVLNVLEDPTATLPPNNQLALLSLTGWTQASLNALLNRFFGSTSLAPLSAVEGLRRVYDAYAIVQTCRVTGAALIAAVTNVPTAMTVSALQSALRAQYAEADWLTVVKPINDTMRINQRDALVAYILQQMGDQFAATIITLPTNAAATTGATQLSFASAGQITAGMNVQGVSIADNTYVNQVSGNTVTLSTGTLTALPSGWNVSFVPVGSNNIDTPDNLYEYLLIDTQNQPPVETSRILLALSAVQLFIERVLRNLEPQVLPTDINASTWEWMKRYRVWQANREVFLWPENWLYPELRDDQSPIFTQMMSSLLQGDITNDAATSAYLDYLTNLEEVAKLEPCGLYYQPGTADADEISYVLSRTAGAHRKYYFRELQSGSWMPWTEVQIDCEDMPITPIVWNNRLFLFWLKIVKQSSVSPTALPKPNKNAASTDLTKAKVSDLAAAGPSTSSAIGQVNVQAVLCWSEYYNGKWQPPKTSDPNRPTTIGSFPTTGSGSFDVDRDLVRIVPAVPIRDDLPAGALVLAISTLVKPFNDPDKVSYIFPGFLLYNTHSLPIRLEDMSGLDLDVAVPARVLAPIKPYTGGNDTDDFTIAYYDTRNNFLNKKPAFTASVLGFKWQPRFVEPQPGLGLSDAWTAPFFYEDRRNLFYVTTKEDSVPFYSYDGYGMAFGALDSAAPVPKIPPLSFGDVVNGDPFTASLYQARGANISVVMGSGAAISYGGQQIISTGSVATTAIIESDKGSD
jgi:hypothetical protein